MYIVFIFCVCVCVCVCVCYFTESYIYQHSPFYSRIIFPAGTEQLETWLDIRAGIFGPSDQRLPLPGNVGLSQHLATSSRAPPPQQHPRPILSQPTPDVLTHKTNHEHQLQVGWDNLHLT